MGLTDICGAKTRRGTPCRCRMLLRGYRCRFHGGMSTGPGTPEGLARCLEALRRARSDPEHAAALAERRRALWLDPRYRLNVAVGRARALDRRDALRTRADGPERLTLSEFERRRRARWTQVRALRDVLRAA